MGADADLQDEMSCKELVELVTDYLEKDLPAPERARFLAGEGTEPHPDGGLRWKWDPGVQDIWSSWTREQTEERWSWIECPVLIVTGATSAAWWQRRHTSPAAGSSRAHSELERRLACFKDARHVEIADAGHMIHFDQPDELNDVVVRFLADAD